MKDIKPRGLCPSLYLYQRLKEDSPTPRGSMTASKASGPKRMGKVRVGETVFPEVKLGLSAFH